MLAIKLIFAGLVLVLAAFVLRRPPTGKTANILRSGLAFVFGLGFTAALIGFGANRAAIVRDGPYAQIAANALHTIMEDPAPYVLFVGASYSRNAINDQSLTRRLRAHGYNQRVITFALEGASLQERDLRLRQFLHVAPRPPDTVFLEISEKFDRNPTYGFEIAKFSERVIGQFDPRGTFWTVRGLLGGAPDGAVAFVKNTILLGLHVPLNWLNVGLFNEAVRLQDAPKLASYDPQDMPRREVTEDDRKSGLREALPPSDHVYDWGQKFRASQRAMLQQAGVRHIAYYFPPVIDAHERAYIHAICEREAGEVCIAPVDPAMLAALDGPVWFDEEHLLAPGAALYDRWLAGKVMASGVLGTPEAHPKLALRTAGGETP
ncbi:MAG: hypothetical protein Q9M33_12385 [Robiginitomaculum sp.]|nr:hypothetical protein [Robiginitomaculum sp.]MDQ7077895.1 hypothetical protein [Robiginitomaculum sp.]